ncbi:protein of unknown function (L domain-like) [endosymbiont DhMRE of Dentiscutata heterogama]|uniref:hypothetical protein n=1 Tax=endosymbiont DhMRE of Dentiscutata heterogama TaxID=1609546 RepID=UPI000629D8F8|nr:hypothetical protein [endosymbiont DhMRE of Dentiscutata heterogama]CFW92859.1 protein of unknown function (L domain-like) [endosymbiont DhMRE of Dentiscutata heterogama]
MTKTAQNWLDTKYSDKTVSKIKLHDQENPVEELSGELVIKDYAKVEVIDFTRQDKKNVKDKITKITIDNCPQVKKIRFNDNGIAEIIFQGVFSNVEWLELLGNNLTKIDLSKFPNLAWLGVVRNPNLTEIEGWENLTKLQSVNLFDTPGLNGKKFKEWKEAINSALGSTSDDPLPNDWKNKLDDLKNRPTQEDLNKAAKDAEDKAVKNTEDKFKDYINPNDPAQKDKLEAAAKNQGMVPKNEFDGVKNELGQWKDKFPNKTPDQAAKETGGAGTGATLTAEQQQKLNDYDKVVAERDARANISAADYAKIVEWFLENEGSGWQAQILQG